MQHQVDRRAFLAGSLASATTLGAAGAIEVQAAESKSTQEFYELRHYGVKTAEQKKIVSNFLQKALLPAFSRMGIDRIGVFESLDKEDDQSIFVLIPFSTLQAFSDVIPRLAEDADYQKNAQELFSQSVKSPAYSRINSKFMKAFSGMPVVEMPAQSKAGKPRIFELRTYESHNADTAVRKVDMFNSGEIDIMRDVKMAPVFFGETLIGDDVPNLTYMLSASDMDAHKEHWKGFLSHPEWDRMKKIPKYKGTVSKIRNWFLRPTEYSQI